MNLQIYFNSDLILILISFQFLYFHQYQRLFNFYLKIICIEYFYLLFLLDFRKLFDVIG